MVLVITSASMIPIIFYYKAQSILFPNLKDLYAQGRINKEKVLKELDPVRSQQAHDLLKQKQQA